MNPACNMRESAVVCVASTAEKLIIKLRNFILLRIPLSLWYYGSISIIAGANLDYLSIYSIKIRYRTKIMIGPCRLALQNLLLVSALCF